ncbi:MAG: VPEID-CTERM sorting domain-containing protein [Chromatiaceae bacterium]
MGNQKDVLAAVGLAAAFAVSLAPTPGMAMGWVADPPRPGSCTSRMERAGKCAKAPEIDATSGVQAIALLSGVLLLVSDRARRRRGEAD